MKSKLFLTILFTSLIFLQAKSQEKMNPVGWFDLNVANLDRAKKFYEAVFNLKLTDAPIEWGKQSFFPSNPKKPNISGALVEKANYKASGNNTIVYFETEDCVAEEKRIVQAGGKVIQPKMNIGTFGFVSIFIDTEGNTVGLHSLK
jgi:predicted enzyme related to lactoylglutathione lyase